MKALVWHGPRDARVEAVPSPRLLNPRDALVRVRLGGITGLDLRVYQGLLPALSPGDVMGGEAVGDVLEVGRGVQRLRPGDRVVLHPVLSCGGCLPCRDGHPEHCDNSNPQGWLAEQLYGAVLAGALGAGHARGGYAGCHAELVRVPLADTSCWPVPPDVDDTAALLLSASLPVAWHAVQRARLRPGDRVAIWGCGPVGLLTLRAAQLQGAHTVLALDGDPGRRERAAAAGAVPLDPGDATLQDTLREHTGGQGADACIDAAGSLPPSALRALVFSCRKGGTVVLAGTSDGSAGAFLVGPAFHKGLTVALGPAPGAPPELVEAVRLGAFNLASLVTHRVPLTQAARALELGRTHQDGCVKLLLLPT